MQEIAIVYAVVAWLAGWDIDLAVIVARGPLMVDPVLKFVVVTICLVVVLVKLAQAHWLW
jgi:hypothetical protein